MKPRADITLTVFSKPGDLVVDYFLGAGTNGLVCKKLKREFIGIEIEKDVYELAVQRIKEGRMPTDIEQLKLKLSDEMPAT